MPKEQRPKERESGTGRGKEVSKQGGGGKYTWGRPGCELSLPPLSSGDPCYEGPRKT
jgi:hypothetical protein